MQMRETSRGMDKKPYVNNNPKTALAKAIAEIQFGSEDNMIRLDMAEFRESHTISKLIGSPAGYIGHQDGGGLTEAVRKNPYTVVLFDEIEKAHPDVLNILLGILDDGRLTDSKGVTCSFKNTIVIMTSNIGSRTINPKSTSLGFNAKQDKKSLENDKHTKLDATIREELKKALRPELLNRIDEIVTFRALTPEVLKEIVVIMTKDVKARLREQEISMFLADETLAFLSKEGMDLEYGARPIARAIKRELEKPLSIAILKGEVKAGEHIEAVMNAEGTAIEFKVVDKALA